MKKSLRGKRYLRSRNASIGERKAYQERLATIKNGVSIIVNAVYNEETINKFSRDITKFLLANSGVSK